MLRFQKCLQKKQEVVLENVCILLPQDRINDVNFKLELIFEMECVIHKYGKTIEDIDRLEEAIGMQEAKTARQYQDQKLIQKGYNQCAFELTLKLKKEIGIEEIYGLTGISKAELEPKN